MSPDFNALHVFAKVVQSGSFTGAARVLEMPKSTVSQRVSELEKRLGIRLLQRTTRTLSLTDAGRLYYERCVRIFADVEDADRAVTDLQETPRGLLRVTVPASSQFLGPVLADFLGRHGGVQLDVVCTDRFVDLVEESFDVAIRAGALSDSTLIARNLGMIRFLLVASPRYLKKRGHPRSPDGLAKHNCLIFRVGPHPRVWRLTQGDETREVNVTSALSVNDLDMLHDGVIGGLGVAMLPAHLCVDDLRAGRLEQVLPDWEVPAVPIQAVYPSGRHLSPKVKALLDYLQRMKQSPWSPIPHP
ncbi:Transcriptional regulator, LysR family [Myxococcus hansupus]|uniref:Transcriptional regulator, LysR family n=1 Tax=Pseudomyxococcus hansupus TaxID=1297742 RepID=A0A0H4WXT1_9BACT|nr:LysR family transcriptional regulator [Myxococcus hansupus]AKQ68216.1 Transcriptional regulator, LysR family [Myxococcus hansupus]